MIGTGIHSYPWVAFFASFLAIHRKKKTLEQSLFNLLFGFPLKKIAFSVFFVSPKSKAMPSTCLY